ncbi:MAG: hypothetical protein A2Z72_06955 [Omnitrophica bacterium RBG_13_46_9]|nr:MAG: hypothetical protein A2Z72_06955 [Omnitrophica bacterium RBG_13_46_9]
MEVAAYRGNQKIISMIFLTVIQGISVIALTLVGILPVTYDYKTKKVTLIGWIVLVCASVIFISTTAIQENSNKKNEEILRQQTRTIEEIRERLFNTLAPRVMEAPKEVYPAPTPEPTGQMKITLPQDGSEVPARTYIEGIVSGSQAEKVWVVVHPMEVSAYWVQPAITVKKDGTWKVLVYLGRAGTIDVGKQFEIMAVGNPEKGLREGDVLDQWPKAPLRSQAVVLTRK